MPDISKNVLGTVIGIALTAVLGFAVVVLHDDYVIKLVMPPMIVESPAHGTAPLLVKLDQRYRQLDDEAALTTREDPMEPVIEEIQNALRNLRRDIAELRPPEPSPPMLGPAVTIERVRLYLSTVQGEENLIVLNGNSPTLSKDIRYGGQYALSLAGAAVNTTEPPLRAELRNLHAPDQPEHAAIGRIPQRYFNKLDGRSRGYVVADIHLVEAPPETP